MRTMILAIPLLAGLLLTIPGFAHEGHKHDAKGTIESIDETQIILVTVEGARERFLLTGATSFSRGEDASSREDVVAGERTVVVYEKKDGQRVAIEVKLGTKAE